MYTHVTPYFPTAQQQQNVHQGSQQQSVYNDLSPSLHDRSAAHSLLGINNKTLMTKEEDITQQPPGM